MVFRPVPGSQAALRPRERWGLGHGGRSGADLCNDTCCQDASGQLSPLKGFRERKNGGWKMGWGTQGRIYVSAPALL